MREKNSAQENQVEGQFIKGFCCVPIVIMLVCYATVCYCEIREILKYEI